MSLGALGGGDGRHEAERESDGDGDGSDDAHDESPRCSAYADTKSTAGAKEGKTGPRFHYVIVDYLCERVAGQAVAGSDVTDVAFASEEQLEEYKLTETATRILKKAFAMERRRPR